MKTKMGRFLAVVVAAAMVLSASCAWAGEGWGGPKGGDEKLGHFEKMSKELDLTPQQKDALAKHRETFAPKMKELGEKMRRSREELKAELDKVTPDKAKLAALVTDLKNFAGEKVQMMVDKALAMKEILTPEQSAKMRSVTEKKKEELKKKHGGKGGKGTPPTPHDEM